MRLLKKKKLKAILKALSTMYIIFEHYNDVLCSPNMMCMGRKALQKGIEIALEDLFSKAFAIVML